MKERIKNIDYNYNILRGFVAAFLTLAIIHWSLFVLYPNGIQKDVFFARLGDFMADFFNVLRYIAGGDPYFGEVGGPEQKIYLPLCYLMLYPFSRLDNYSDMSLAMCQNSKIALMSAVVFTLITCFFLYFSLKKLCEKYKISNIILIPLLLSGLFVYTIERANLILVSISSIAYFIALYDSDSASERRTAIIMLAVAACIKVYPALFGLLYIRKKMYKELLYAAGVSFLLAFLPFLFFKNGFNNIPKLISNVSINSDIYSNYTNSTERFDVSYLIYNFLKYTGFKDMTLAAALSQGSWLVLKLLAIFALILSLFVRDEYTALVLITLGIMFLPAVSFLYCGVYLFPAIILLFKNSTHDRQKILYHAVFYLFYLSPLQYRFGLLTAWYGLVSLTIIFFIIILLSCIRTLYLSIIK